MHNISKKYFKTVFLPQVREFFKSIDKRVVRKIIFNIDFAEGTNDPRLFKKLNEHIWEFRTKYGNLQYRLLAFWDKTDETETLVIATHGIIKKTDKVPGNEIKKADSSRKIYFNQKNN